MTAILSIALALSLTALSTFAFLYFQMRGRLKHYADIQDLEAYRAECEQDAAKAVAAKKTDAAEATRLNGLIAKQKQQIVQYKAVLGDFKSAAELRQHVQNEQNRLGELRLFVGDFETAATLQAQIATQRQAVANAQQELEKTASAIGLVASASEIAAKIEYSQNYLDQLKKEVEAIEETRELQTFGFYQPKYSFDSSERYQAQLEKIRGKQKAMLKAKSAATCVIDWTVDGSRAEGKKMVDQQIKLTLRAYNGECDAAISKVKYNNATAMETRINRAFEQISKLGKAKHINLSEAYHKLKLQELYLVHEHLEKKQEEKEEQRRIREQLREEEKVVKEIEQAQTAAERDEALALRALERARQELALETGKQTATMQALVAKLEGQLSEALDRKAKAIARAQLTKSGHVYVLSNIGSFGEGVYKIGMTRRLEPLERVYELGDSSVPFYFDVHSLIYSENAPQLECQLHRYFAARRVNKVNLRREFFRVSLPEIMAAVKELHAEVTFVTEHAAEQYRKTMAMEAEGAPLQVVCDEAELQSA
jgi:hypothetical protein